MHTRTRIYISRAHAYSTYIRNIDISNIIQIISLHSLYLYYISYDTKVL